MCTGPEFMGEGILPEYFSNFARILKVLKFIVEQIFIQNSPDAVIATL